MNLSLILLLNSIFALRTVGDTRFASCKRCTTSHNSILGSGVKLRRRNEGYPACWDVKEMLLFYCNYPYPLRSKSQIEDKKTWQALGLEGKLDLTLMNEKDEWNHRRWPLFVKRAFNLLHQILSLTIVVVASSCGLSKTSLRVISSSGIIFMKIFRRISWNHCCRDESYFRNFDPLISKPKYSQNFLICRWNLQVLC